MEIEIIKANDNVVIEKAHSLDIGYDVYAQSVEWKEEYGAWVYDTGIRVDLPKDIVCNVVPNSGVYKRNGFQPGTPGIVDPGYQGTIKVIYKPLIPVEISEGIANFANTITMLIDSKIDSERDKCDLHVDCDCLISLIDKYRKPPFEIGEKIGQLIFNRTISPDFKIVTEFSEKSERGERGLGSGHKSTSNGNKEKRYKFLINTIDYCMACDITCNVIQRFISKYKIDADIAIQKDVVAKTDIAYPICNIKDSQTGKITSFNGSISIKELLDIFNL